MTGHELQHEIEQFLCREARLLDERRWRDWLDLLTHDVEYVMPVRETTYSASTRAVIAMRGHEQVDAVGAMQVCFFDETKETLEMRIRKLESGSAWAEEPPSRTRHFVTNVLIEEVNDDSSRVEATSNFLLYRSRLDSEEDLWVGCREDVLRRVDGGWKLARRRIVLDQTVLKSKNLTVFF